MSSFDPNPLDENPVYEDTPSLSPKDTEKKTTMSSVSFTYPCINPIEIIGQPILFDIQTPVSVSSQAAMSALLENFFALQTLHLSLNQQLLRKELAKHAASWGDSMEIVTDAFSQVPNLMNHDMGSTGAFPPASVWESMSTKYMLHETALTELKKLEDDFQKVIHAERPRPCSVSDSDNEVSTPPPRKTQKALKIPATEVVMDELETAKAPAKRKGK